MAVSNNNLDSRRLMGGISANSGELPVLPIHAAPSTDGRGRNTIRMELIPVGCWKLNDVRFAFGSSFLLPDSRSEFLELAQLRANHPDSPLSIFGHADPIGDDDANKRLSGRRAESVYATLIRDAARWEKLYTAAGPSEGWGLECIQHMLSALGENPGSVTGTANNATTAAINSFQEKNDLSVDGKAGSNTRLKLFAKYMEFLHPAVLRKEDFLAKGADPDGKGDFQGCSEFNPTMLFSDQEEVEFQNSENLAGRNEENGVNRRVMVLLFRKESAVPPGKWPCPRTNEGVAACKKRFWSDGEQRRSAKLPDQRRLFETTKDTFGCRFYHRLTIASPCEGPVRLAKLSIRLLNVHHEPLKNAPYSLIVADLTFTGKTSADGVLVQMVPAGATEGTLKLEMWTAQLVLTPSIPIEDPVGTRDRLHNLGYFDEDGDSKLALMRFQGANDEECCGELNESTRAKLRNVYGC
jgi:hypothetical protein